VDDLESDLLAMLLVREHYAVVGLTRAEEATQWLKTNNAKVAVIDLALPGKSGLWLIQKIREFDTTLPIIILTGHPPTEAINQILAGCHIRKVVLKTADIKELLKELRGILG
jgi:DNA-binding response OmpR family regulator